MALAIEHPNVLRASLAHSLAQARFRLLRRPEIMVDRLGELGKANLPKGAGARGAGYSTLHVCICRICYSPRDWGE